MKRTFFTFFFLLTLCSAAAANQVYHPFVEAGKLWKVHGFNVGSAHCVIDYYFANEEETIDGKTYLPMYEKEGERNTLVGLFREENQRVYLYKKDVGQEYLTYDFSLQEGDRFTPEYGDYSLCEVKKVGTMVINGESLKTITFEANDRLFDADVRTEVEWIEGIGYTSRPLAGLFSKNMDPAWYYYTAYVLYDNTQDNNYYLPLTFGVNWNGWWGQQPQTVRQPSFEGGSKFEYELLPDPAHDCYQLHVYGDTVWSNSPNRYAYCVVEKSSSVYKVSVKYEELEPCIDGIGRYHVDLYFPFFLAEHHYVTVDNYGEHPVPIHETPLINTDYRPFIEEGKVWKVGWFPGAMDIARKWDYYYFEGDSIIDGRQCKIMRCRHEAAEGWGNPVPWTEYVGSIYEEGRRVYCLFPKKETFELLYDFASAVADTICIHDPCVNDYIGFGIIEERGTESEEYYKGNYTAVAIYQEYWDSQNEENHLSKHYDHEHLCYWMEGVGSGNPLDNVCHWEWAGNYYMGVYCTVGDEVLYKNTNPYIVDGVTPQDSEVKKNWLDFTHTVKTKPKAPVQNGQRTMDNGQWITTSDEETVTGEYSVKELFVNFKTLTGPYTITVTDAAGQPIYNKEVQTSNVVALNTDISTYPKGSYTITVENEEEAYTAKLSIDEEVGIGRPTPDPSLYGGEKAGAWYDMSGRKVIGLSLPSLTGEGLGVRLPRGIYIRGGRKVVVK